MPALRMRKDGQGIAKGIYFSDLKRFGPAKVKIISKVRESREFKKPEEQGYYNVALEHEGFTHTFNADNRQQAEVLAAHQGEEVTVIAEGDGRNGTASLRVEGDSARNNPDKVGPQDTPKRWDNEPSPTPAGVAQSVAGSVLAAQKMAFTTTLELKAWVEDQLGEGSMPDSLFQSCFQNVFITLSKEGLINKL